MFQMSAQGICDQRVALPALFAEFLKVSLCSFGSGLVWTRRSVIDRRHWMSEDEFADTLSLIQFLPGPKMSSASQSVWEQSCEARQVLSLRRLPCVRSEQAEAAASPAPRQGTKPDKALAP
jgi:hypothetical protein